MDPMPLVTVPPAAINSELPEPPPPMSSSPLAMFHEEPLRYDDPEVRPLMDLEGLKAWNPGRTSGYAALASAVDRFGTLTPFLAQAEAERA